MTKGMKGFLHFVLGNCIVGASFAASATEPVRYQRVADPVIGQVQVNVTDAATFRALQPNLLRAQDVAREMGVRSIPIQSATYSGVNYNPHYDPMMNSISIGGLPPRQRNGEINMHMVSLHEVGHAVLVQYLAQAKGMTVTQLLSQRGAVLMTVLLPVQEMFADLYAMMLMNNASGISGEIAAFVNWYRSSNILDQMEIRRQLTGRRFVPFDARAMLAEALRRDGSGNASRTCSVDDIELHNWFDSTRRMIWQELYVRKFNRSPESISEILKAVADEAVTLMDNAQANLDAYIAYENAHAGQPRRAMEGVIWMGDLGEDYFDNLFLRAIRAKFL